VVHTQLLNSTKTSHNSLPNSTTPSFDFFLAATTNNLDMAKCRLQRRYPTTSTMSDEPAAVVPIGNPDELRVLMYPVEIRSLVIQRL
jgi:hypothetical protein